MKQHFTLFFIFFLLTTSLTGQRNRSALGKPVKFIQCNINDQKLEQIDMQRLSDRPWVVYVVNSTAQFYNDLSGGLSAYRANFMEKLVVVEVRNDYLRVVKDDQMTMDGLLSRNMLEIGWIHQDNLLMSDLALKGNDARVIPAFVCDNMMLRRQKEGFQVRLDEVNLKVYQDPLLTIGLEKPVMEGEFYYAFKTTNNSILIGKRDRIDGSAFADDIVGWISNANVYLWESRLAVEPNWDPEAAIERKDKAIYAQLFLDLVSAAEFAKGKKIAPEYRVWAADIFEKRYHGSVSRFPLLAFSGNLLKVSVIGMKSDKINKVSGIEKARMHILVNPYLEQSVVFSTALHNASSGTKAISSDAGLPGIKCIEAFTTLYHAELVHPVFRFVVLLSRSELQKIIDFYNSVKLAVRDERTLYHMLTQRLHQLYPDKSQGAFDHWSINQAVFAIIGTSFNFKAYAHARLSDLTDDKDTDNEVYDSFSAALELAITRLEPYIKASDQGISFVSNQTVFYWVPFHFIL